MPGKSGVAGTVKGAHVPNKPKTAENTLDKSLFANIVHQQAKIVNVEGGRKEYDYSILTNGEFESAIVQMKRL